MIEGARVTGSTGSIQSLELPLEVEDGWPPVALECLPFRVVPEGHLALVPPLFVKDLSVGDVIHVTREAGDGRVLSWRHVARSGSSTVWLLRMRRSETIDAVLTELRDVRCNTVRLDDVGAYAIEVPPEVPIAIVDAILAHLDSDAVAVAFPSMRHDE